MSLDYEVWCIAGYLDGIRNVDLSVEITSNMCLITFPFTAIYTEAHTLNWGGIMTHFDWRIRGPEISTCNCDWGCPCQFNSLPTHGNCRAGVAMRIDEGHFGDVSLNDLHWAALFAWPKAIHEGNGEALLILDERAGEAQREALLAILSGETSTPGATMFSVFASTLTKLHDPVVAPILFEADFDAWTGEFSVPGYIEAKAAPITNPVSGESHQAKVTLPGGFEYHEAEFVSSRTNAAGPIPLDWVDGHGHLCMLHMAPSGPIR